MSQTIRSRLPLAHQSDSFIDASLSGHLVSAANDDAVAITKSVRDLHQVAEGLSDGDLTGVEAFWCVLDVDGSARAVAHDCGRGDEQHSSLIAQVTGAVARSSLHDRSLAKLQRLASPRALLRAAP